MYSLTLCSTDFIWCTERLSQGSWRKAWERSYPPWPRAMERVSTGSSVSHTLLASRLPLPHLPSASFGTHQPCAMPIQLPKQRENKPNSEPNTFLPGWRVEAVWERSQSPGKAGRESLWLGEWTWDAKAGGGRGSRFSSLNSFQLSCATSPWDTEHWLHSSSISSFVKQMSYPQTFFVIERYTYKSNIL